jgi:predicted ATP-grasp superfamily ATP-dependent carboligase
VTRIAVAAISARLLAEAAAREGHDVVVALDLFGDADTRRASARWEGIGAPGSFHIDGARLLAGLAQAQRGDRAELWVAGSGFEGAPDLLERGAALLPLAGTPGAAVRRLRDPQQFFAALAARGIPHPPVRRDAPVPAEGWLTKHPGGCGGWQVRRAGAADAPAPGCYFQREVDGAPMSLTYLANGRDALVLGFNRLLVAAIGVHPFVFRGAIGPVPLAPAPGAEALRCLRELVVAFDLRGLGSLDFLRVGDTIQVLEVNARPPASLALYPEVGPGRGVLSAHLEACAGGELPAAPAPAASVRGHEIVYARTPLRLDATAAARLAAAPARHDLPQSGAVFAPGEPVCSVETSGADADEVQRHLARLRDDVLASLENSR